MLVIQTVSEDASESVRFQCILFWLCSPTKHTTRSPCLKRVFISPSQPLLKKKGESQTDGHCQKTQKEGILVGADGIDDGDGAKDSPAPTPWGSVLFIFGHKGSAGKNCFLSGNKHLVKFLEIVPSRPDSHDQGPPQDNHPSQVKIDPCISIVKA